MNDQSIYFRRKLPHYQPSNATFFITFRLANSLPREIVMRLRKEREEELRLAGKNKILSYKVQRKYFGKFDEYLDRVNHGQMWLRDKRIAKLIADTLQYWNGKRYELQCYCIMPNHVHLVLTINGETNVKQVNNLSYALSRILHSIKRHTAREANTLLGRTGAFWQHESYDHVVRNGKELERIISYVLHNPMTAGLTKDWQQWKWSYVRDIV